MANEIWTIKRCLEWTKEYLAERGEEHPRLSAEWLLCAATGLARIDLYMRMDETLNAAQLETMHAAVVRRAKGEPLQYITGSTQYQTLQFLPNCLRHKSPLKLSALKYHLINGAVDAYSFYLGQLTI